MDKEPTLFVGVDWASKEHQVCTIGTGEPQQRAFVNGARKWGHLAFEKGAKRCSKSTPLSSRCAHGKGPRGGPFHARRRFLARSGVKNFAGVGIDGLGGCGRRPGAAAFSGG
jgi:hypothetical protein